METKEFEKTEKINQKIQLVKGEFTPSDASDIIFRLINDKINFHNIQRRQIWERNHKGDTKQIDLRIQELQQEKEKVTEFISNNRDNGKLLKINGILEITFID